MSMEQASVENALQEDKKDQGETLNTLTVETQQNIELDSVKPVTVPTIREQLQAIELEAKLDLKLTEVDETNILKKTSELEVAVPTQISTSTSILSSSTTAITKKSTDNILVIQSRLDGMKDSLFQVISSLDKNPSVFSKWSRSFGVLSWFQKIGTGAVLPTLFVVGGLAASAPIVIIVGGGGSALLYSGAALLLDDHYQQTSNFAEQLRSGVGGLIDLFGHILFSLEQLREDLKEQVKLLTSENEKFCKNIDNLQQEVGTLTTKVEVMSQEVAKLQAANVEYSTLNDQLKLLVNELEDKNNKLDHSLKGASETTQQLGSMMANLANYQIKDTKDRDLFLKGVINILEDKENIWENVSDRMSKAEMELVESNKKFTALNKLYSALLDRNEKLVSRFEKLMSHPVVKNLEASLPVEQSNAPEEESDAHVMGQIGLMGRDSCAQELQNNKDSTPASNIQVPVTL